MGAKYGPVILRPIYHVRKDVGIIPYMQSFGIQNYGG